MTTDSQRRSIHQIAKGGIWLFVGMFISKVLNYLYKIVVARIGAEEFGIFSSSTALVDTISTIAALGLPAAIFYFIPHYEARNETSKLGGVIRSSLALTFMASLVFAIILFLLADTIAGRFLHNARSAVILRMLAFIIPVANMRSALIKMLIGFKKIKFRVYARNIAEDGTKLLITILFLFFGFGLASAIYGYMAGMLASLAMAIYLLERKTFAFVKGNGEKNEGLLYKDMLKYSLPLFMAGFVGYFLRWTDTFVLSYFRTMEEVGIYNVAIIVAGFITIIPEFFMPSAYPVIVNSFSAGNKEDAMHLVKIVNKWIFLFAIPVVALLSFSLGDIVATLFGDKYVTGVSAAIVLLFGKFFWTISNIGLRMLTMIKKNSIILFVNVGLVIFNIIFDIIFVPRFGIIGAAFPTSVALIAESIIYIYLAHRHFGTMLLPSRTIVFILAGALAAIPTWWIEKIMPMTSLCVIGIESCVYLSIYAILLWMMKALSPDDINVISMALKKVKEFRTK